MLLEEFKKQRKTALIAYIVAGHKSLDDTEAFADTLVGAGVDILELGVPFSDAMADGPVIQEASETAAAQGFSLQSTLELATRLRHKHSGLGIVLFTYFNPLLKAGLSRFAKQASQAGVNAVLTVDLPPEESAAYCSALSSHGVGTVFLASPTTDPERLGLIEKASTEFVYYVSRTGVTGVRSQNSDTLETELARVRQIIQKPLAVGFGISNAAQAAEIAPLADAVVVGSAFVKCISQSSSREAAQEGLKKLTIELKNGIQSARKP
jgi:tryptophan synthase alpha chain